MSKEILTREFKVPVETREKEDGKRTIAGCIPFNSRSEDMGFYEYIAPTAFNKTLKDGADVRALMNHETSKIIGRVKNGTLRLSTDDKGLQIECDLPDTTYAKDAYVLIRDGYCTGMSFGFTVEKEEWQKEQEDDRDVRILKEVRLLEVSFVVAFPAYEATDSSARSIRSLVSSMKHENLSEADAEEIKKTIEILRSYLPEEKPVEVRESTPAVIDTEAVELNRQLNEFLAELRK